MRKSVHSLYGILTLTQKWLTMSAMLILRSVPVIRLRLQNCAATLICWRRTPSVTQPFSKHWLFSTLMKLIEEVEKDPEQGDEDAEFGLDVDEELQNELCKLWDISMNMDVARFLQEFKAIDILISVIGKSKAPRVTEICVGILGNMACDEEISQVMSENTQLINLILMLFENRDPPTLVETTRLLYTSLSKSSTSGPWITAVSESEEILNNLIFILNSSTNCDLLKNAGEVIDILLDQREDLCDAWATSQFVTALMEAIKQIGCHHSEALEIYFHIFQMFSTMEKGVETLVACSSDLEVPLMKYLGVLCEDEIVGLDGREACLASTLSVLNILFLSDNSVHDKLTSNENLIRIFIKILEPLSPLVHMSRSSSSSDDSQESSQASSSSSQTETGEDISQSVRQNGEHTMRGGGDSNSDVGGSQESDQNPQSASYSVESDTKDSEALTTKLSVLYNIIKGFLYDLLCSLAEQEYHTVEKTLVYLNSSCSRVRLKYLIFIVKEMSASPVCALDWLTDAANIHKQERLTRIIDDVLSGRNLNRTRSDSCSVQGSLGQ
ncbi:protein saal1-like [Pecten maximus]|uniref:protein saal1-like n=1 Tax=Pecten maximus TaxID=6579 RepID=UPI001458FC1B|nr:protein saal1-like [Pecten maximus]